MEATPRTATLFASESIALAAVELLVRLGRGQVLGSYRLSTLSIPDSSVRRFDASDLPLDWRADPAPCEHRSTWRWLGRLRSITCAPGAQRHHPRGAQPAGLSRHPDFAAIAGDAASEPFGYDLRLA